MKKPCKRCSRQLRGLLIDLRRLLTHRRPPSCSAVRAVDPERPRSPGQFANAFKDVENPPVDIEFSDGRRLSLSEYRIKKAFQVESRNKIPIVEDVCTILVSWLRQQIGLQNLATF